MYRKRYSIVKPVASALIETLMQDVVAGEIDVDDTARARALKSHRKRLRERGRARFDVLRLDAVRKLIRAHAPETPSKGGILAALRRSPLVDAELDVVREPTRGRKA